MQHGFDTLLVAERVGYTLEDGRVLLDELTLGFGRERTGLVGPNGIGKTTLARIMSGALAPSRGHVIRAGRLGTLSQRRRPITSPIGPPTIADALGIAGTLATIERVLAGSGNPADLDAAEGHWDLPDRVAALLDRLGLGYLPLDRPLEGVSGGEATRLALGRLLLDDPDFLILDEPTNDLDAEGRAALYRFVEEWTGGLLVITHDRALLGRMDRILGLSGLGARLYGGNYDVYVDQREAEREAAARDLAHARKELRKTAREAQETRERQERRSARGRKDAQAGGMPKILIGARKRSSQETAGRLSRTGERRVADAAAGLAEAKSAIEDRETLNLELIRSGLRPRKRVLEARNVGFTYPDASAPALAPVSLQVIGPERIALVGPNGAGKTTLLRILAGELGPTTGAFRRVIDAARVAYVDQHAARLDPDASVLENFRRANPDLGPTATRYALSRFLFRADAALARVGSLSGGERLRAALACALCAALPPQLLLLDEPTNHLDLDSLDAVERAVRAYDGALVVISHDAAFLEAVGVERRVVVTPAGRTPPPRRPGG